MPSRPLPNIVLLTLDSVRVDHLSAHGYHRETTPFLDQVAADHIAFT